MVTWAMGEAGGREVQWIEQGRQHVSTGNLQTLPQMFFSDNEFATLIVVGATSGAASKNTLATA